MIFKNQINEHLLMAEVTSWIVKWFMSKDESCCCNHGNQQGAELHQYPCQVLEYSQSTPRREHRMLQALMRGLRPLQADYHNVPRS